MLLEVEWTQSYQRTSLDDVDTNIFDAGVYLLPDEFRRCRMYSVDALRVLCGKASSGSHSIAAIRGDHLLICL